MKEQLLGASILAELRDRGTTVMATTHFPGLKSFAHEENGFMNASYSFDEKSLSPSYRLLQGIPGRSLGIESSFKTWP